MPEEAKVQRGVQGFVSYSHQDRQLREELEKHLGPLRREGRLSVWHDREIRAGESWDQKITEALESAEVILLLISPDFLASDYAWDVEMRRAMERHEAGEARVIPVILRPVDWHGTPFGKLQALPRDARPLTAWEDRDEAFLDVVQGIRAVVEQRTRGRDRLTELELRSFSVFDQACLRFCPGLNVLIGLNATGKTHVMKLAYALLSCWAPTRRQEGSEGPEGNLRKKLADIFQPEEGGIGRLVRHSQGAAEVSLRSELGRFDFRLEVDGTVTVSELRPPELPPDAIFIPSRETLAMYEGFVAAYENRELSFDQTYYDLCVAMSASPLRANHLGDLAELLDSLEQLLGGRVRLRGNRFYLEAGNERTEAHLLAEGLRRIAVLAHLIRNGSLGRSSILFWDEPEANLNPKLVTRVAEVLVRLAAAGFQIVLATHDYLLAHELSLAAEYPQEIPVTSSFIALYRESPDAAVRIESAPTLADLEQNPILEEYAAHHAREQALFQGHLTTGGEVGS